MLPENHGKLNQLSVRFDGKVITLMFRLLKSPVVVALVIMGGLWAFGSAFRTEIGDAIAAVFPLPSASVVSSSTIIREAQTLGQLVTYEMPFAKANIQVIVRYGVANICRIGALHTAEGRVEAGVDLQQLDVESMRYDAATNTYHIQLPAPTITDCSIDPLSVVQYHTFGEVPITCPADMDEIRRLASFVAINDFRAAALETGILEESRSQAAAVIRGLVEGLTDGAVEITFAPAPAQSTLPASCRPNPPGNWAYDPQTQDWRQQEASPTGRTATPTTPGSG
jgi:hypothetical protein